MSEKLLVPDIGDFENVEVIEILVKPGDQIKQNDPIVTIESDKSSVEIPSIIAGKVDSLAVKVGDKVSKGDLLLNLTPSSKTSPESTLPKDTENIIKQAEEAIAEKKEEKKIISEPIIEKKQSTIQVVNGKDIDPLETQDWLESLSAVISKDGNHRAHFLIKELINKFRKSRTEEVNKISTHSSWSRSASSNAEWAEAKPHVFEICLFYSKPC